MAPNLQNASLLFKINLLISLHHNQKGYIFIVLYSDRQCVCVCGPGSSVGIATDYRLDGPGSNPGGTRFSVRPDRPWGPPSLLYNEYRVFPGGKVRPGRAADHSPPSSAAVMEEYSYTSTHSLGHTGPVTGSLYLIYTYIYIYICVCVCVCGVCVCVCTDEVQTVVYATFNKAQSAAHNTFSRMELIAFSRC